MSAGDLADMYYVNHTPLGDFFVTKEHYEKLIAFRYSPPKSDVLKRDIVIRVLIHPASDLSDSQLREIMDIDNVCDDEHKQLIELLFKIAYYLRREIIVYSDTKSEWINHDDLYQTQVMDNWIANGGEFPMDTFFYTEYLDMPY